MIQTKGMLPAETRRVIVDTSTLIGALLRKRSVPNQVLLWVFEHCSIYASPSTLQELAQVVRRPGFDKYASFADRMAFFEAYADRASVVIPQILVTDCRDPKDNKFLELALHIQADVLVTSDDDLLTLNPWRGIAVLSPTDFMASTEKLKQL
jgi:putative PIN family toxin of toxin-antitoxin system